MTIRELYNWGKRELRETGVLEPESSAEFLLRQILGVDRAKFYTILNQQLTSCQIRKYRKYIERRRKHEPVWQIVGRVEFWGMDFFVNQDVLVPRPETELLVEQVLQQIIINKKQITNKFQTQKTKTSDLKPLTYLDIGTGAGTIAIALAKEFYSSSGVNTKSRSTLKKFSTRLNNNVEIVATDISKEALKVAKKNAKANGVADMIQFIQADLFNQKLKAKNQKLGKFDVIIANLPYISHEDLGDLALEIHHYEPRVALDGGPGGLVIYERFLKQLLGHFNLGGMAFCEIGKDQGKRFCTLAQKYIPKAKCKIQKDFTGIDRIAIISSE